MIEIAKIIETLEKFAPLEMAETWDNTGWQINLGKKEANKILLCLSLTPNILEQAIQNECDLIISHHPLIFGGIKKIEYNTITQKPDNPKAVRSAQYQYSRSTSQRASSLRKAVSSKAFKASSAKLVSLSTLRWHSSRERSRA